MKFKKTQEEMVGFVVIIILVIVIALIFLSLSLAKPKTDYYESERVESLLESISQYTTGCYIAENVENSDLNEIEDNVEDLVRDCYNGKVCLKNGKTACENLEQILSEILNSTYILGKDSPVLGYEMTVYYNDSLSLREYVSIIEGNCTYNKKGAEYPIPSYLAMKLEVCYA